MKPVESFSWKCFTFFILSSIKKKQTQLSVGLLVRQAADWLPVMAEFTPNCYLWTFNRPKPFDW